MHTGDRVQDTAPRGQTLQSCQTPAYVDQKIHVNEKLAIVFGRTTETKRGAE